MSGSVDHKKKGLGEWDVSLVLSWYRSLGYCTGSSVAVEELSQRSITVGSSDCLVSVRVHMAT